MSQHKGVKTSRFFGTGLVLVLVLFLVFNTFAFSSFGLAETTKDILVDYSTGARENMRFQPEWIQQLVRSSDKPEVRVEGFLQEGNEIFVKVKNLGDENENVEVILINLDTNNQLKNYLKVDENEALYTMFFLDEEPGEYYVQIRLEIDNVSQDVRSFPIFL